MCEFTVEKRTTKTSASLRLRLTGSNVSYAQEMAISEVKLFN